MSTPPRSDRATGEGRPARRPKADVDRKLEAKTLAALGIVALLVLFAVVNSQKVSIDFVAFQADAPLVIALIIAMLLGFVLGNLTRRRTHRLKQR